MADNKMKLWVQKATKEQLVRLADLAGTSVGVIRQIAGGYRTGGVASATPETAGAIAKASKKFAGLPELERGDLCQACSKCEHYKRRNK